MKGMPCCFCRGAVRTAYRAIRLSKEAASEPSQLLVEECTKAKVVVTAESMCNVEANALNTGQKSTGAEGRPAPSRVQNLTVRSRMVKWSIGARGHLNEVKSVSFGDDTNFSERIRPRSTRTPRVRADSKRAGSWADSRLAGKGAFTQSSTAGLLERLEILERIGKSMELGDAGADGHGAAGYEVAATPPTSAIMDVVEERGWVRRAARRSKEMMGSAIQTRHRYSRQARVEI